MARSRTRTPTSTPPGALAPAGVVDTADPKGFIAAAKTRQWAREAKLRTLA